MKIICRPQHMLIPKGLFIHIIIALFVNRNVIVHFAYFSKELHLVFAAKFSSWYPTTKKTVWIKTWSAHVTMLQPSAEFETDCIRTKNRWVTRWIETEEQMREHWMISWLQIWELKTFRLCSMIALLSVQGAESKNIQRIHSQLFVVKSWAMRAFIIFQVIFYSLK